MKGQYSNLTRTVKELDSNGYSVWDDSYGKTVFQMINSITPILSQNNTKYIVSDYLKYRTPNGSYDNIVSIGGFSVHNQAKIEAQKLGMSVSTIPIPLSNDSFGTNRCSAGDDETCASFQCIYPSQVYFCLDELLDFGIAHSINGIGEFIGLYYSYIDYCLIHHLLISNDIPQFILSTFREMVELYGKKNHSELIRKIAVGLVYKCLMMRISDSHEIGCGIDHFFTRIFEDTYSFYHGKSVFLGSILSSISFKHWKEWGLSTEELINNGISLGIISKQDIDNITQIDILQFVADALQKRPMRATNLRTVSQTIIESNFNSFKETWATLN